MKQLILDWDGTIVNSDPLWFKATKKTFSEHGIDLTKEDYDNRWSTTGCGVGGLIKDHNLTHSIDSLKRIRDNHFMQLSPQITINPGVNEFLHSFGKRIPVVTGSPRSIITETVKHLDIQKYLDIIITADEVSKNKPDPEPYLKAAEILNRSPSDCLVIEDSAFGIESALRAGMQCISVNHKHPHVVAHFKDFHELTKEIHGLLKVND